MRRTDLLRHLRDHGCVLLREGSRHSWWHNPKQNRRSAVPRHNEIDDHLARKFAKTLGFNSPDQNLNHTPPLAPFHIVSAPSTPTKSPNAACLHSCGNAQTRAVSTAKMPKKLVAANHSFMFPVFAAPRVSPRISRCPSPVQGNRG